MLEILIGAFSGIFSGIGMGGGTILIFLLTTFGKMEQHIAQATNLIYFVPTAISAIIVNFKNKNMFRNLKKLDIGDKLYITDREVGKVEYEIFDIYKVFPENTSCLTPTTNEREVTLITCNSIKGTRIVIKAKENR